ncbi:MAG: T9SS type A sorting domain-containing protein [Bacteroidetes bacterium]|nr:T9SS type A sorting domain-containing protein [Bacteroidota bacterium]
MRLSYPFILCFYCILFLPLVSPAQLVPVGNWQSHFSYNSAKSVEKVHAKMFAADANLYSYSVTENEYTTYSKVNGLNDVNISFLRFDAESDILLIVYENSNIDLMLGNIFINIPDIKNANLTGSKRINSVYFKNKLAYLCTDFGIVVLNLQKYEIKETYILQQAAEILKIKSLTSYEGSFYAATSNGIYKANENSSALQNFASWVSISDKTNDWIFTHHNKLYCADADSMFVINADILQAHYQSGSPIYNIRLGNENMYLCEKNDDRRCIMILNQNAIPIDSTFGINPNDVVEWNNQDLWEADEWEGLIKLTNRKDKSLFNPNGAFTNSFYSLTQSGEDIYVASGGDAGWQPSFNSGGISKFKQGTWTWFNRFNGIPNMDSTLDITSVAIDKRNQNIYATSFGGGLLEIHPDKSAVVYKNNGFLLSQIGNPGATVLMDVVFDDLHNLWMTNYGAAAQVVVKKADGTWQNFTLPFPSSQKYVSKIIVDDSRQKWVIGARGTGLFVLNDNNTIDNKNDDQMRLLTTGTGNGNLPNNEVLSIAKDRDGKIWVGTNDGIGIINCPENIFESGCEAELKIVKYDLNAGLLFQRESINAIAVDGANHKWIGTNNGVWLISDDAEKIIHQFNKDNSPLPSNEIKSIVIQPVSGEVFIATNEGLVSYRSEATDAHESNAELLVFPNPVPSNYAGTIAIKGLVENADVRITDVAGQLVYRTKALGGQAVWNGKNYLGQKPHTGVYLVFVSNADGSESKAGKFIYNE